LSGVQVPVGPPYKLKPQHGLCVEAFFASQFDYVVVIVIH
jgi:hypothetical protein